MKEDYLGIHSHKDETWSSALNDLFSHDDPAAMSYIKEGREFWYFDPGNSWRKIRITYVRSGVMFFVFEDEPDKEKAWFLSSFNAISLVAAHIYVNELNDYYINKYGYDDFPQICKECQWQTFNNKIEVTVVW